MSGIVGGARGDGRFCHWWGGGDAGTRGGTIQLAASNHKLL